MGRDRGRRRRSLPGTTEQLVHAVTFIDFAKDWTDGKLHERFPDHVGKKKDTTEDARMLRMYVEPIVRDVALRDFTLDHAEQIMAALPAHLATASRRHVAQVVRRVLALAVYPARHITEVPIPRGWLPKVKASKALVYLYPEEDRALLGCTKEKVPLVRRLFFGVLAREGLRREELAALRFRDLDLERGHIVLDQNKTDDPRGWALDPHVTAALKTWRDKYRTGSQPDDYVFAEDGCRLYVDQLAASLRDDLREAGVTREVLFEKSDVRRPLRVHDLRATFVTVSLANGKTETWVADRTGHRSSEMINRYRRAARTWGELDLGGLAPLDSAIPELASVPQGVPHGGERGGSEKRAKSSGEKGIRTPGTIAGTPDFESGTFDHSDISPPANSAKFGRVVKARH